MAGNNTIDGDNGNDTEDKKFQDAFHNWVGEDQNSTAEYQLSETDIRDISHSLRHIKTENLPPVLIKEILEKVDITSALPPMSEEVSLLVSKLIEQSLSNAEMQYVFAIERGIRDQLIKEGKTEDSDRIISPLNGFLIEIKDIITSIVEKNKEADAKKASGDTAKQEKSIPTTEKKLIYTPWIDEKRSEILKLLKQHKGKISEELVDEILETIDVTEGMKGIGDEGSKDAIYGLVKALICLHPEEDVELLECLTRESLKQSGKGDHLINETLRATHKRANDICKILGFDRGVTP